MIVPLQKSVPSGFQHRLIPLEIEIGPSLLIFSLVIFVAVISVITLVFSTKEVTKGYVLKDLESKREALVREFEIKTTHVAEIQSIAKILENPRVKRMVRPGKIEYLPATTEIAQR